MIRRIFTYLLLALCTASAAVAQDSIAPRRLSGKDLTRAAKRIASDYKDWQEMSVSGKIRLDGIPVSPSIKVYMVRDERIAISMRVPFLGELATVDITPDTFCIVNKYNKTYVRDDLRQLIAGLPVNIGNVQDLLLGRVFMPGGETFSTKNYTRFDIYDQNDLFVVVPRHCLEALDLECGFATDPDDGSLLSAYLGAQDTDDSATVEYTAHKKKRLLEFTIVRRSKERSMGLEFDEPDRQAKPLKAAEPDARYRKVSLTEFFKHLT